MREIDRYQEQRAYNLLRKSELDIELASLERDIRMKELHTSADPFAGLSSPLFASIVVVVGLSGLFFGVILGIIIGLNVAR